MTDVFPQSTLTKEKLQVKRMLRSYLIIACHKNRTITAETVADVFRFGIQEEPGVAAERLTRFVNEGLPAVEAAVLEGLRELLPLQSSFYITTYAVTKLLKSDPIAILTSNDERDARILLTGRRSCW